MIDEVPEKPLKTMKKRPMGTGRFRNAGGDLYLSNPIARSSALMAELSRWAQERGRDRSPRMTAVRVARAGMTLKRAGAEPG